MLALGINPDNADFYFHRGNAHYKLEDYQAADVDYTETL